MVLTDNTNDPESIEAIRKNWNEIMDQKLSIACFTEENGEPKELVGLNILMVKCTDDDKENVEKVGCACTHVLLIHSCSLIAV